MRSRPGSALHLRFSVGELVDLEIQNLKLQFLITYIFCLASIGLFHGD